MKKRGRASSADELRKRAEEIVLENVAQMPENLSALSPEDALRLLQELRVHQIELEMQNDELLRIQMELEDARALYFDLYDLAPVGYLVLSEKNLILEVNLTAASLLGVARNALMKKPLTRFILPKDQDIYYIHRKQLLETGGPCVCELRMMRNDGSRFWARLDIGIKRNTEGVEVFRAILSDITERIRSEMKQRHAEEALRQSQILNQKILSTTPDIVYIFDLEAQQEIFTNRSFANVLGYAPDQADKLGSVFLPADVHPDDSHILRQKLEWVATHAQDGNLRNSEYRLRHANGEWRWIGVREIAFRFASDGTPNQILGIAQDITERRRAEDDLHNTKNLLEIANRELHQALEREQSLARTDGLTGLYNYRHFYELAVHEYSISIRYRRPLSILMFDVDEFKQVNDTVGHTIGDYVLAQIARAAAAQMRAVDVLARYGGDEFVILLPQTSAQQALPIAERIRESVATMHLGIENGGLAVTLSIGIAGLQSQPQDESLEYIIQHADKALYRAKAEGRNRTVIYSSQDGG